jgi:acetyltransferase-like isoleucine patch superfamily enzyme
MLILKALTLLLPWPLRRWALNSVFGYQIHPESRIGFSWVFPQRLKMEAHSKIGHLTVCKGLELLEVGSHASIGRGTWITGFPRNGSKHFEHQVKRVPSLLVGEHASITNRHLIDCTNSVSIGAYSILAGFRSQILTHSIDLEMNRQSSAPITIGNYCFIGTDCVLLGGSVLPDNSVLGAKSLLNKSYSEGFWLYAGNPARPVKPLAQDLQFFTRRNGFVY